MARIRQEITDLMSGGADVSPDNFIPAMRELINRLGDLNRRSADAPVLFNKDVFGNIEHGVFGDMQNARGVIFHIHGGGFVAGGVESHRHLFEYLASEHSYLVVAPAYPLVPEASYEQILASLQSAFKAVHQQFASRLPIYLSGDSAGATLALSTALSLRADGGPLPRAIATFSAITDLRMRSPSLATLRRKDIMLSRELLEPLYAMFAPGDARSAWRCSPIEASVVALPPLLMQVGSEEILRDDSARFVELALAGGTRAAIEVWPEMFHVWHNFPTRLPEARQALTRAAEFFSKA